MLIFRLFVAEDQNTKTKASIQENQTLAGIFNATIFDLINRPDDR